MHKCIAQQNENKNHRSPKHKRPRGVVAKSNANVATNSHKSVITLKQKIKRHHNSPHRNVTEVNGGKLRHRNKNHSWKIETQKLSKRTCTSETKAQHLFVDRKMGDRQSRPFSPTRIRMGPTIHYRGALDVPRVS